MVEESNEDVSDMLQKLNIEDGSNKNSEEKSFYSLDHNPKL